MGSERSYRDKKMGPRKRKGRENIPVGRRGEWWVCSKERESLPWGKKRVGKGMGLLKREKEQVYYSSSKWNLSSLFIH